MLILQLHVSERQKSDQRTKCNFMCYRYRYGYKQMWKAEQEFSANYSTRKVGSSLVSSIVLVEVFREILEALLLLFNWSKAVHGQAQSCNLLAYMALHQEAPTFLITKTFLTSTQVLKVMSMVQCPFPLDAAKYSQFVHLKPKQTITLHEQLCTFLEIQFTDS